MTHYVLHPGDVVSRNDGDVHRVSADRLVWLYKLRRDTDSWAPFQRGSYLPGVHLYPDPTGVYDKEHPYLPDDPGDPRHLKGEIEVGDRVLHELGRGVGTVLGRNLAERVAEVLPDGRTSSKFWEFEFLTKLEPVPKFVSVAEADAWLDAHAV